MSEKKYQIYLAYTSWVSDNNKRPEYIEAFVIEAGFSEKDFMQYFDSFQALERSFWADMFNDTLNRCSAQEEFAAYSVNEKLLAIYFTLIEMLKGYRGFVVYALGSAPFYEITPEAWMLFKKQFVRLMDELITEGQASGEIAKRPWITDKYKYILWAQPLTILRFWIKDESEGFMDTDALIEKTVNFSFDLMRSNSLDSFVDLAKFHFQHR